MNCESIAVRFTKLTATARVPVRATDGSVGLDLYADRRVELIPLTPKTIGVGLAIQMPPGLEAQIRPRSGLAKKGVVATFGTVDNDYRGEIGATLIWFAPEEYQSPFVINEGDRFAQLVFASYARVHMVEMATLSITARGANGFGSTGV